MSAPDAQVGIEPDIPPEHPEPEIPRGPADYPDLRNWGGIRKAKAEVRRSATIVANREAIAYEMLAMASTKITDVMKWDEKGNVTLIPSAKIDERHARMIKAVKQKFDKDGNVTSLEVVLFDKVSVLRTLAQAAGILQKDADEDKPAVVGVTLRGPGRPRRKTVVVDG